MQNALLLFKITVWEQARRTEISEDRCMEGVQSFQVLYHQGKWKYEGHVFSALKEIVAAREQMNWLVQSLILLILTHE